MTLRLLPLTLVLVLGCASAPATPATLRALDATSENSMSTMLRRLAPTEMAAVQADRAAAHAAAEQGDTATAELYAERGLARVQVAKLLTERALLEARVREAEPRLLRTTQELARLGQEQSVHDTRIRELELRSKVAGDTEPRVALGAADTASRAKARQEAAKSLSAEATLLCGAARLLGGKVDEATSKIPNTADFERAVTARAACLAALEAARRSSNPAAGKNDALLEQLSKTERFAVKRDERGVVVTLPAKPSDADLETLGRSARGYAVQIVVHDAGAASAESGQTRGDNVKKALLAAGADSARTTVVWAGSALPVGDPAVPALRGANERVEIVYVQ